MDGKSIHCKQKVVPTSKRRRKILRWILLNLVKGVLISMKYHFWYFIFISQQTGQYFYRSTRQTEGAMRGAKSGTKTQLTLHGSVVSPGEDDGKRKKVWDIPGNLGGLHITQGYYQLGRGYEKIDKRIINTRHSSCSSFGAKCLKLNFDFTEHQSIFNM